MGKEKQFFKSQQVRDIIGLTRRQMQYWAATGLVVPSYSTPGGHARYTFEDLVALKTAKRLLGVGVSVQRIRKVMNDLKNVLPKIKRPLSELTLVATGDVILVFYEDTAFEAITGQQWILELAEIQRDIEKWEKKLQGLRKYRRVPPKTDQGISQLGSKFKPYGAEKAEGQGN
jgi:DNA-binding transcriptional MerR regulator